MARVSVMSLVFRRVSMVLFEKVAVLMACVILVYMMERLTFWSFLMKDRSIIITCWSEMCDVEVAQFLTMKLV